MKYHASKLNCPVLAGCSFWSLFDARRHHSSYTQGGLATHVCPLISCGRAVQSPAKLTRGYTLVAPQVLRFFLGALTSCFASTASSSLPSSSAAVNFGLRLRFPTRVVTCSFFSPISVSTSLGIETEVAAELIHGGGSNVVFLTTESPTLNSHFK